MYIKPIENLVSYFKDAYRNIGNNIKDLLFTKPVGLELAVNGASNNIFHQTRNPDENFQSYDTNIFYANHNNAPIGGSESISVSASRTHVKSIDPNEKPRDMSLKEYIERLCQISPNAAANAIKQYNQRKRQRRR